MKNYINVNRNECNLTDFEKRGIRKLRKRVKEGEIVIYLTDKSGKMFITTPEIYLKQGSVHVQGDKVSSWKEV